MNGNSQWLLRRRPRGEVQRDDFEIRQTDRPVPGPDEVLVRSIFLLVPPSTRLWMTRKPTSRRNRSDT